jgi:glucose-6-phosphate isomerase
MNLDYSSSSIDESDIKEYDNIVSKCHDMLHNKTGLGNDFLGWLEPGLGIEEISRIKEAAKKINKISDLLIVVGIGGSYLGARAVIESLSHTFLNKKIIYAGNNLSPDYINDLFDYIKDKDISINVISKSGTTTEPAIAFKLLKEYIEKKYGKEEAKSRIYITTDKEKGILKKLAEEEGYETFVVPDDIGGRYSVLTSVGLLPIAVAGIDIEKLISGAKEAAIKYSNKQDNDCYKYAVIRNILYKKNKITEILVNYEPKMHYFTEWWKQLFGESEGKENKGIFPAGVDFTTDLHSMGQYIQEGERNIFETVVNFETPFRDIIVSKTSDDDGLSYLEGKTLNEINHKAMEGTVIAHTRGGVPNIILNVKKIDEHSIGELIYFFEKACAISGYILGVNPFNQPGVEKYKSEMFRLLGK